MDEKIEQLKQIIKESDNIVFFGGAGVSTESGIPDFRGSNGIYFNKEEYRPEEVVSHDFFVIHPKYFYDFFFKKMVYRNVKPNPCHYKLAELEKEGKLKAIITQNIDSLHQLAGSKNVIQLHGTVESYHCTKCHKHYSYDELPTHDNVPYCSCGGIIKPDVVLYNEPLNNDAIEQAVEYIRQADTLIIGGTSLVVYPAAGLIRYFRGRHLVIINEQATQADERCELVIRQKIGKVFSNL